MKIVINKCYAEYGNGSEKYKPCDEKSKALLIHYSTAELNEDGTLPNKGYFSTYDISRNDTTLIKIVEEMGVEANGPSAELKIVEIPDGIKWEINKYHGIESIHEKHSSWD